jgi:predicted enzyme related to lactoylglutathione lyase
MTTKNALNWFEIYVKDMSRAHKFWQEVLAEDLRIEQFGGKPHAVFPSKDQGVGGALVQDEQRKPSGEGCLVYLNVEGQLDACLERVSRAGGAVVLPRTGIGEHGFIAMLRDCEGNVVGLHSMR